MLAENGRAVRAAAFVTTTPGDDDVRVAAEQNVDLVSSTLLATSGPGSAATWQPCSRAPLAMSACSSREHTRRCRSRSCRDRPFGGAEHEWAALEIGAWIAGATGARLELLGTAADPDAGQRDASRLLATASLVLQQAGSHGRAEACAARPRGRDRSRSRRRCHSGRATGSLASARPRRRPACPRDAVAVTRAARTRAAWRPRPGPEPHSLHVDDRSS